MKKNDVILILIVLIAAAAFYVGFRFMHKEEGGTVVITIDGAEYMRLPLDQNQIVELPGVGGTNTLEIREGSANMITADCPDKICVRHNSIKRNGETIVCLPHRVMIEITGGQDMDTDAIVR